MVGLKEIMEFQRTLEHDPWLDEPMNEEERQASEDADDTLIYHLKVTEEDQTWSGIVVDAEGCMTQGSSESEVVSRAAEALDCHLRAYLSLGQAPPFPVKHPETIPIKVEPALTAEIRRCWGSGHAIIRKVLPPTPAEYVIVQTEKPT